MNIQHPASNIQRPKHSRVRRPIGCSLLDVGYWMFLFFTFPAFAQPATNTLPTLAPAYGQMPPTFWEQHGVAIIIGSLTVFVVAGLVVWKLLQPKPPVVVPPETAARRALTQLQGRPEDGKMLSEVSQILRRYSSAAFGLPATEMTTTEFCAALTTHKKIGPELAQSISSFLRVCDKDKFSPKIIAPPINAVDRARELISLVETRRAPVGRASSRAESKIDGSSVASPHQPPAQ